MLIFYEMTPPVQQNSNQNSPTHPNDHLIPVAQPSPSPVIKVPRLPGVEQPSKIRVERVPQFQNQQPIGNNFGNIAKSVALIGGGIAAGALAHKWFGGGDYNGEPHQSESNQQINQPTKVSTQSTVTPNIQKVVKTSYPPKIESNAAPATFFNQKAQPDLVPGRRPIMMSGNGSPFISRRWY